ncbi:hypothetical protein [Moritella sp. JT01]|nr:hypothetical protein [Moritella sp. JT01]
MSLLTGGFFDLGIEREQLVRIADYHSELTLNWEGDYLDILVL